MTPAMKNEAATQAFMAQHGPEIIQWYAEVLESAGGLPPFDRRTAVAHESGHTVVGLSLGGSFKHISVYQERPRIWCGWTEIAWPPGKSARTVDVLKEPRAATEGLVYQLAGFLGEQVAGLEHPASSPDEVYPAIQAAAHVGRHRGIDPEIVLGRVMGATRRRIEMNRGLFDAIRAALRREDSLTPSAMARLIEQHGVVQVPLKAAW